VLLLIFIYYYKGILSISDIQKLMQPITEDFFETTDVFDLEKVYEEVFSLEDGQKDVLKADVAEKFKIAQQTFSDAPEDKQEFLKMFSFISMLSFDVYVKKLLIENLIDSLMSEENKPSGKNAKKTAEASQTER
jgi:hypothetical protein